MRKAVVFVDVQNDFITGTLGSESAQKVLPAIIKFAKKAKEHGWGMYATRDTHGSDYMSTLEGANLPVKHCVSNTDGWQIAEPLRGMLDDSNVVDKPTFGSFPLARKMKELNYDEIVLCGFCTDICVVSNALLLRAAMPNTKIAVARDLCAGTSEAAHESALAVMQSCMVYPKDSTNLD